MKNKFPLLFIALFSLIVVGCQGGSSSTDTSSLTPSSETSEISTSLDSTESSTSLSSEELPSSEPISSGDSSEEPEPGEIPTTLNIHYHRDDGDYIKYAVWLWDEGGTPGKLYDWDTVSDKWATKVVQTADFQVATGIYLIFRLKTTWAGQTPDAFIRFSDYPIVGGVMDVYCIIGTGLMVEQYALEADALGDRITDADFISFTIIQAKATAVPTSWTLYANGTTVQTKAGQTDSVQFILASSADLAVSYELKAVFPSAPTKEKNRLVGTTKLYDLAEFKNNFLYTGNDLGATYTPEATTFKVWAPTSSNVDLHIYSVGRPSSVGGTGLNDVPFPPSPLKMTRGDKGVFTATVPGDWNLKYYTYIVTNASGTFEVVDPYAKSAGINGLRGQIIDFDKYEPEGFDEIEFTDIASPTDLTVYELHVQDLTLHESWNGSDTNRGKFLGLIEEGTSLTKGDVTVKTGFDHIKELGVNAVQLMPFYDQSNTEVVGKTDYNWGYNPLNYNVLEGSYSSNPLRGEIRVQEMKQVVKKFAENDIRIVMDVVYNHVASASASNFQKLVPGYFFRYDSSGALKNESGVGNDFATERDMARKFIVESVKFWAEEYQIKGFRFDLMGLIDDITLKEVDTMIKTIDSDIVLWGEPWSGAGYRGAEQVYNTTMNPTNFAAFNDQGRNGLKGDNNVGQGSAYGFIQKGPTFNQADVQYLNKVKGMLAGHHGDYYGGGTYKNPTKTVNYAGCHDNYTVFDQMTVTTNDPKNASLQANALVLTGQGIPFFQGGDEIMRTKKFDPTTEKAIAFMESHGNEFYTDGVTYYHGNSYNADWIVNAYLWEDKIDNLDYFERYKELIQLRKENPAFRMSSAADVANNFGYWQNVVDLSYSAIASWNTKQGAGAGAIYSFYAADLGAANATQTISWGTGSVIVLFDSTGVRIGQTLTNQVILNRYQTMIVQRVS